MKHSAGAWWLIATLGLVPIAAAAETVESIEKQIAERAEKITSLAFTSTYKAEDSSHGGKIKTEGTSSYEFVREGDGGKYRMETTTHSITEFHGTKNTSKGTTISVSDGEYVYMLNDYDGSKSAMKQKATPMNMQDQWGFLSTLQDSFTLTVLPDEKVGDRATWVIQAVPKQSAPNMPSMQIYYIDKETGLAIRMIAKNAEGKVTMETTTSDIKVNSTISDERFVLDVPDDVQMIDMTQMQQYGQPQGD